MTLAAKNISIDQIPVVDIGPLREGNNSLGVARAIDYACREVGFLYVANHGIDESVIANAHSVGLSFFRRDPKEKLELQVGDSHRGFLKIGASKMYDDAEPDLKESFIWGVEVPSQDHLVRAPNRWPDFLPELKPAALTYFDAAHGVAKHLLRAFALALELPEETFLAGCERPMSRATFTYYPPQDAASHSNRFGVSPHTDFGVLTVLYQDEVGGLQVQGLNGEWMAAHPIPGTLVINVGDLLSRWTNGYYRSTPHRVINSSGKERLSLVCAYDPDHNTLIDPSVVCAEDETPKELPITCGAYLSWRFKKAFDYRG